MTRSISIASVLGVVALLAAGASLCAQPSPSDRAPNDRGPAAEQPWEEGYAASPCEYGACEYGACDCYGPPRITARAEYLMWWSRGRNVPPLVTTSPQTTPRDEAGVLGFPTTTILYGDEPIGEDFRSGGRFSLSYLLATGCTWAEGRIWGLEDSSESFLAASNGDPILARPFFNALLGQEDALLVAFPGVTMGGSIQVRSKNDLFGADAWVRQVWCQDCCIRLDVLAGYQFIRLDDALTINNVQTSIDPNSVFPFGTVIDNLDSFATRNEFHGGQLGIAAEYCGCCWNIELLAKLALGGVHEEVAIAGRTITAEPGAAPVVTSGGLLAQPTNIGRYQRGRLAIIPEVNVNLAYDVNPCWRLTLGYSFLYWSNAVLAGNQIDRAVNLSQVSGPLVGPARPQFTFNRTDYWVQGMNFGLQYRW
ncbi:MAG TPA: BBP7 family outer membrane beta-barrel protein [Pirellulaceae bacterium]|nr:BBP7 family outer membrane beta-barrel protein [Pirellulaceae bacterium]